MYLETNLIKLNISVIQRLQSIVQAFQSRMRGDPAWWCVSVCFPSCNSISGPPRNEVDPERSQIDYLRVSSCRSQ